MLIPEPPKMYNRLAAILCAMTIPWYALHGQWDWTGAMAALTALNAVVGWKC